mgnify:CR=1 FL=1
MFIHPTARSRAQRNVARLSEAGTSRTLSRPASESRATLGTGGFTLLEVIAAMADSVAAVNDSAAMG